MGAAAEPEVALCVQQRAAAEGLSEEELRLAWRIELRKAGKRGRMTWSGSPCAPQGVVATLDRSQATVATGGSQPERVNLLALAPDERATAIARAAVAAWQSGPDAAPLADPTLHTLTRETPDDHPDARLGLHTGLAYHVVGPGEMPFLLRVGLFTDVELGALALVPAAHFAWVPSGTLDATGAASASALGGGVTLALRNRSRRFHVGGAIGADFLQQRMDFRAPARLETMELGHFIGVLYGQLDVAVAVGERLFLGVAWSARFTATDTTWTWKGERVYEAPSVVTGPSIYLDLRVL